MSIWKGGQANCRIASGSYTGNDSENRAIPHGLNKTPKFVELNEYSGAKTTIAYSGNILYLSGTTDHRYAVTGWDDVNFYVGNVTNYAYSGNAVAHDYHWVAFT